MEKKKSEKNPGSKKLPKISSKISLKGLKTIQKKKEFNKPIKPELTFDLEQQFILRLPPSSAKELREDVESGSIFLKDKLSIEMQQDMRHAYVRYGKEFYNAKLMDFPCITETYKTLDRKTFYKAADVSQMLLCTTEDEASQDETESPQKKKDKDKKYHFNHGITPPLKNVRKRRFRKTLKKKYMEQPDIEKEVRRLFRADAEALDVKWEVTVEDEKTQAEPNKSHIEASGTAENPTSLVTTDTQASFDMPGCHDIFGDLSSSDEEIEKDINVMDSGEDDTSRDMTGQPGASFDLGEDSQEVEIDNTIELKNKLNEVMVDLETIKAKKGVYVEQIAKIENHSLKMRVQASLDTLIQEEQQKEREYEILQSVIGDVDGEGEGEGEGEDQIEASIEGD